MVEAQDAHRSCILWYDSDTAVAEKLLHEIAGRQLPPIDFPGMQRRHGRKRIQCQPLDPIEMRNLRPSGKAHWSRRARLVRREPLVGGAGAEIGRASCREECRSRWSPYH